MSTKSRTATPVEIFGSVYYVRGDDDRQNLQELAKVVDKKMREVAEHLTTVDDAKIAILAALNLADEFFRYQKQQEGERGEIKERVAELTGRLAKALDG